jgi:hypothetical protein
LPGRRWRILLARTGLPGQNLGPVLRGISEDRRNLAEEAIRISIQVAGPRLFGLRRLEGCRESPLDPEQAGREAQGFLGRESLPNQELRARGSTLELRGDLRDPSSGASRRP